MNNRPLSPANPADIAEMKRKAREAEREFVELMDDVKFRRYLWRMLAESGVFREVFTENSNRTAHSLGKRALGLWVMKDIDALCPERYSQMVRENAQQQQKINEDSDD